MMDKVLTASGYRTRWGLKSSQELSPSTDFEAVNTAPIVSRDCPSDKNPSPMGEVPHAASPWSPDKRPRVQHSMATVTEERTKQRPSEACSVSMSRISCHASSTERKRVVW